MKLVEGEKKIFFLAESASKYRNPSEGLQVSQRARLEARSRLIVKSLSRNKDFLQKVLVF